MDRSPTGSKSDTRRKLQNVQKRLNVFFKNDAIGDVTTFQAKNYRGYLKDTVHLGENTIRRHIGMCRQLFNAAIDARIIERNPFLGQPVTVIPNKSKFFYVTPEIAKKVLEHCPDAEWKLIFGLARYGGLRCPSEVLSLKWTDIDFGKQRFTVHSPKTEHHIGQDQRIVPMFPELKPLFQDAFDKAREGAEAVYFRKPIVVKRYSIFITGIEPKGFQIIPVDIFPTSDVLEQVRRGINDADYRNKMVEQNYVTGQDVFQLFRAPSQVAGIVRQCHRQV